MYVSLEPTHPSVLSLCVFSARVSSTHSTLFFVHPAESRAQPPSATEFESAHAASPLIGRKREALLFLDGSRCGTAEEEYMHVVLLWYTYYVYCWRFNVWMHVVVNIYVAAQFLILQVTF